MRSSDSTRRQSPGHGTPAALAPVLARDGAWAGGLRVALGAAGTVLAALLALDLARGTLDPARAALWCALGAALFAVLLPPRVTAGADWLQVRDLLHVRRVRTDELTALRRLSGGLVPRLVLVDVAGERVELDLRVLNANPRIRQLLETGAACSRRHGLLTTGPLASGVLTSAPLTSGPLATGPLLERGGERALGRPGAARPPVASLGGESPRHGDPER